MWVLGVFVGLDRGLLSNCSARGLSRPSPVSLSVSRTTPRVSTRKHTHTHTHTLGSLSVDGVRNQLLDKLVRRPTDG